MRICSFSALVRGLQNLEAPFGKVLILFQRSRHCGELNRGLKNLEKLSKGKFQRPRSGKGFKLVCAKFLSVGAELRFAEPRYSLQRKRVVTFCIVQKVTKKHAGLRPATSIQIAVRYMIVVKVTGIHQVTGYAGNCSFPGIAGNDLNRCEVPALQRKELSEHQKNSCILCKQ